MGVPIFLAIHRMVVEIFHFKPHGEEAKVIEIHPLGTMDICTKCHGDPIQYFPKDVAKS